MNFLIAIIQNDLPSHKAPSVSRCLDPNGDEPKTGASLPTCKMPSLLFLEDRVKKKLAEDLPLFKIVLVKSFFLPNSAEP